MSMKQVNLMHMFIVGPLLTYIGTQEKNTPEYAYHALGGISLLLPFIVRIPPLEISYYSVTNSMHYVWLILFLYISFKGKKLPAGWYKVIALLGISVISIHAYLLYQKLK